MSGILKLQSGLTTHIRMALGLGASIAGCTVAGRVGEPIFIESRAVAAASDTLLAFTAPGRKAVFVFHTVSGDEDSIGAGELSSPLHVQILAGRIYVSDYDGERSSIAVFAGDGRMIERIDTDGVARTPHQFAVLPDGRVIVESADGRLVTIKGDSAGTFAAIEDAAKPGMVVAYRGGVLHALPDHSITLYNGFGHILWRVDWPWRETAVLTDLAIDAVGRPHVLAAVPSEGTFIVYTLSEVSGEVVRWSAPGPQATYLVRELGETVAGEPARWLK